MFSIITQSKIDSALQEANHSFNIEVIGRFNAKYQLGYKAGQILRDLFMADSELIKTLNKYNDVTTNFFNKK